MTLFRMLSVVVVALLATTSAQAQQAPGSSSTASSPTFGAAPLAPTAALARQAGFAQRQALMNGSLVQNEPLTNIGPTVMSGRVVDLDVNPANPTEFYVAYASGGLWHTQSNGITFAPLFEEEAVMTIGDIAVDWASGTLWVGTGENNSSRSSYAGLGVYKSTDGGASWTHQGLAETHRTGRIVLHPTDPQTLWVAAIGPLYSPSEHRGVYKSTDGGATWTQTLYEGPETGVIDLALDPTNPDVLYASTWTRSRTAWNFVEGGDGSAIYKSTDGGSSWTRLTTADSGFPSGEIVGRIGLAVFPENPDVVYALLDNQARRPAEENDNEANDALAREDFQDMTQDALLALDDEALNTFLRRNGFPADVSAERVKTMAEAGTITAFSLYEYLTDANRQLFDTPVVGAEVYRSLDGGQTWSRTHTDFIDALYYSYGYYFGEIRVDPQNADKLYILGVPILTSDDGGASWRSINEENVHVDHHALWVNPAQPGHLILGNDGGVNISYDDGATWFKGNTPTVGQFYAIQVDDAQPYNVYGGLQDNGVWYGPHTYAESYQWYEEGDYPYDRLLGGDGMQVEVDTRTNQTLYTGFQFGNYFRVDKDTGRRTYIQPRHELGERPLRFNWQTPIHLSRHNQDILYLGANKLYRSMDQGDTWTALSEDLTQGGRPGDVPFGTLATLDESPLRFGLLYTGSDDGLVHVTRDAGASWQRISDTLPQDLWVSRVEASAHAEGRVYVTLNGYRTDHFEAYLYVSNDYGASWQRLGTDLPPEPVNVVVEDPSVEDLLYVGTDHGLYLSIDRGQTFMAMMNGLPHTPVHDLKVQDRDADLLVGTHGRSIYRADLERVRQLPALQDTPLAMFEVDGVRYRAQWGSSFATWAEPRVPEVMLAYLTQTAGAVTLRVLTPDGTVVQSLTDEAERGINRVSYALTADPEAASALPPHEDQPATQADDGQWYLTPGLYTIELTQGGETVRTTLDVEAPPPPPMTPPEPSAEEEEEG
ncbi:MAG: glycosyl hydrolase [Bacteroidota bacterium]